MDIEDDGYNNTLFIRRVAAYFNAQREPHGDAQMAQEGLAFIQRFMHNFGHQFDQVNLDYQSASFRMKATRINDLAILLLDTWDWENYKEFAILLISLTDELFRTEELVDLLSATGF
jgi:hypothetical protein